MQRILITAAIALAPALVGAQEIDAKKIFDSRCSLCHGVDGTGSGPAGASLKPPPTNFTTADYWKSATPEHVKSVIISGKPGTAMVPFGAVLKPDEIEALAKYVRGFGPKEQ